MDAVICRICKGPEVPGRPGSYALGKYYCARCRDPIKADKREQQIERLTYRQLAILVDAIASLHFGQCDRLAAEQTRDLLREEGIN